MVVMKRATVLFVIFGLSLTLTLPVLAQDLVLSDRQIEGVRSSCVSSQVALKRVHTADALLRVNVGQRYENISLRLMAPLNSRVAINGLDVVDLATISSEYTEELKSFVTNYRNYEIKVSNALKVDCEAEPIAYYSLIDEAREGRSRVRGNMLKLSQLIKDYREEAETFSEQRGDK